MTFTERARERVPVAFFLRVGGKGEKEAGLRVWQMEGLRKVD